MTVHLHKNTDKEYKCVTCGSDHVSIIREDKTNPRLKCNTCNFMFNASDSLAAEEAGSIPTSSPESLAAAQEPEIERHNANGNDDSSDRDRNLANNVQTSGKTIPRIPRYVFVSKDRKNIEFCGAKDIKKVALQWAASGMKYDCYELTLKKSVVKLELE